MNESDFENELRAMTPRTPSPGLAARIAADLARQPAPAAGVLSRRKNEGFLAQLLAGMGWAAAGAAAAVATMLAMQQEEKNTARAPLVAVVATQPDAVATEDFQQAAYATELLDAQEGEVVYAGGQSPSRRVYLSYIERTTYTNSATGAVLEVEQPREDVILMPVSIQ